MVHELTLEEIDSIIQQEEILKNFSFTLTDKDRQFFCNSFKLVNTEEDFNERAWYFEQFSKNIRKMYINPKCRQLCVVREYPQTALGQCISMIHMWIDFDKKLNLTVYMRSWNYEKNFDYDCQTFLLLLETFSKILQKSEGKVEVICNDLHLKA